MQKDVGGIRYDERGLVPAVVQDARSGEVLTLAYMSAESLRRTLDSGETWFWSRSRAALWHKGETSGNTQRVVAVRADCDRDALLVAVEPSGPACHTGARTCFDSGVDEAAGGQPAAGASASDPEPRGVESAATASGEGAAASGESAMASDFDSEPRAAPDLGAELERLHALAGARRTERPAGSYTTYLFDAGLDKILKKIGEESAETIIAAKNEGRGPLVSEVADLLYHLVVLLVERGVGTEEIAAELARRGAKTRGAE